MSRINLAFTAILKYGTPKQKEIIRRVQQSSIVILSGGTKGSGSCGVTDAAATQRKIDSQIINEIQALGELTLRINPITEASNVGLQGT